MYKTFEEAKAGAHDVITRIYGGNKMSCVVTESKLSETASSTSFGFRFYSDDTNGEYVPNGDGSFSIFTKI